MPKRTLRRWIPRLRGDVLANPRMRQLFGNLLQNDNLWHLNRHSVAWGVSVGLFMSFIPLPVQMVLAAAAAIAIGCNLPIAVAMVWISNPITMPPLFYAAYRLGAWLMGQPPLFSNPEPSWSWLGENLLAIWQPFLLGCFLMGLVFAVAGHVVVKVIWRIHVTASWRARGQRRRPRPKTPEGPRAPNPTSPSPTATAREERETESQSPET